MKRHLLTIIIAFIFLLGLSVFMYPLVSDYINARNQTRVVLSYHADVAAIDTSAIDEMLEAAHAYNAALRDRPFRFHQTEDDRTARAELLNVAGRGVIGTLEAAVIDVHLPIYHGTGDSVLQVGIGHLEGSSLPVGGPGTHAAITGHRGLPSSTLLTNLDRMVLGDTFMIRVLNEALYYQVDRIVIVEPADFLELEIIPGMDYVSLITCTPYGINSHRMLVRGVRTDPADVRVVVRSEARSVGVLPALAVVLAPIVAIWIVFQLFKLILRRR